MALDCDLGRLWIRPETLSDKLAEWIIDEDLDFAEHPQFSRRYLCRSDHPDRVTLQVPQRVWESIGKRDDILVLSRGSHVIAGKGEYLKPEDALDLVDLAVEIMEAFSAEAQLQSSANRHLEP